MRTEFHMHLPRFDWHPARRHLRHFAWLTALFLAVLSWTGGVSTWTLSLRLAAAFLFAIGTVLPGVLRWPYVALLLILSVLVRLFNRILRTLSLYPAPRHDPGREPGRFHLHHDRQPATGTHG
jgi:hypothetical protein